MTSIVSKIQTTMGKARVSLARGGKVVVCFEMSLKLNLSARAGQATNGAPMKKSLKAACAPEAMKAKTKAMSLKAAAMKKVTDAASSKANCLTFAAETKSLKQNHRGHILKLNKVILKRKSNLEISKMVANAKSRVFATEMKSLKQVHRADILKLNEVILKRKNLLKKAKDDMTFAKFDFKLHQRERHFDFFGQEVPGMDTNANADMVANRISNMVANANADTVTDNIPNRDTNANMIDTNEDSDDGFTTSRMMSWDSHSRKFVMKGSQYHVTR